MASNLKSKWFKGLIIGFSIFIFLFLASAIILPIVFKKQILEAVKTEANKQLKAKLDFKDVALSLIWTFPNFSFDLKELTLTGKNEFDGLKLADINNLSLRLNLFKVIAGDYVINSVVISKPKFYIKVLKNGMANYDIVISDTTAKKEEKATEFKLKLNYYAINNADIIYDDAPNLTKIEIKNLTHSGNGDLSSTSFDFFTQTNIDELSLIYDRISYLTKTKVDASINLNVDMNKMAFKLLKNSIKLNALELNADGLIVMGENDIKFDQLKINSPSTSFASVLSMIPAAYTKDFSKVKTKGVFSFNALVNGIYNDKTYPAFDLNLKVNNAEFQYPELPMAVTNINTDISVKSNSSDLDKMAVNISRFNLKIGNNPFEAVLKILTPISDPNIDTKVKGRIDLSELSKAFPMESVSKLIGILDLNLEAKTKMSYVEKEEYDKVDMKGKLALTDFIYNSKGMPDVFVKTLKMEFTPNNVLLDESILKIGKSDITASGKLDNILCYFSGTKIMKGNLIVRSNLLDLNDMTKSFIATSNNADPKAATNMIDTSSSKIGEETVFDRWDFSTDFQCSKLLYDVYDIQNLNLKGEVSPSRADIQKLELLIGKVDIAASGELENIFGYLYDNQELKGELNLNSKYMNLNQFMSATGQATESAPQPVPANPETVKSEYEPIQVPANINFHVTAAMGTLIYEAYQLKNVKADLRVRDQKAEIISLTFNAFGGNLALNGEYNSKNTKEPTFKFGYDVRNIDFQEFTKNVPLVSYFAPVLKSVFGKFNSQFKMNGILGKNLYPKLSSISEDGLLETYNATLKAFAPIKGLSEKLKIKELEALAFNNTKNFFSIQNGKLILKPFAFKHSGIDMTFGGEHGLDQNIKYNLKMRIPRTLLDKAGIGQATSEGMKLISGQASKLGIKIEEAEFINVGVDVLGTIKKPTFTPKVLGAEGKSGQSLGDQVKESIKDEVNKIKEEAEARAKAEAEKLRKEAEDRARAEAEKLAAELEAKARAEADRLIKLAKDNEQAKRIRDSIESAAKAAKEKLLKDKLKNIPNPFKKN